MNIPQTIEAILFFKGEPLSVSYLSKLLGKNEDEIRSAFEELKNSLEGRGIVAVIEENSISLGTHPEVATLIQRLVKQPIQKTQEHFYIRQPLTFMRTWGYETKKNYQNLKNIVLKYKLR